MTISSVGSSTSGMEENLPILVFAFMLMTPEPSRVWRRYSSASVRLPKPFSETETMKQGVMSLPSALSSFWRTLRDSSGGVTT
jgi:hypothetical protein